MVTTSSFMSTFSALVSPVVASLRNPVRLLMAAPVWFRSQSDHRVSIAAVHPWHALVIPLVAVLRRVRDPAGTHCIAPTSGGRWRLEPRVTSEHARPALPSRRKSAHYRPEAARRAQ